ncbi:hypothetical protein F4808DRAFT_474049 [Astrocystis sublimbata]|nr:hypothetical protein F4808DRAFT_476101 [Astrocystis sublimbata]KAI0196481.1 hypothetical protein F4808DRAFT_474049 [Astrocystis sublimbata]
MGDEYKPYTTPYTGAGAVKTEQGWVSSRDLGAPGAASGPGPATSRRNSQGGPSNPPAFHQTELTATNVSPPIPDDSATTSTDGHRRHRSSAVSSCRSSRRSSRNRAKPSKPIQPNNPEVLGIKGPDGVGYELPGHYSDAELARLSNRDVAMKIGLLNLQKGNIHEDMHQAATNRDILSREPAEQFRFRGQNDRSLARVEQAIRAWEEVQTARIRGVPNPGLVDMLMISQDYHEQKDDEPMGKMVKKGATAATAAATKSCGDCPNAGSCDGSSSKKNKKESTDF